MTGIQRALAVLGVAAGAGVAAVGMPLGAGAAMSANRAELTTLVATAQRVYHQDVVGALGRSARTHLVKDHAFMAALAAGRTKAARAQALATLRGRAAALTVVRSGQTVLRVGTGFDIASSRWTVALPGGPPAQLQIAAQSMLGYIQLVHHLTGAQLVARDQHGHEAATIVAPGGLPTAGTVSIGGTPYLVASFAEPGASTGSDRIWLLAQETGAGAGADTPSAARDQAETSVAQRIYDQEDSSAVAQADLRAVAANRSLLAALGAKRLAAATTIADKLLVNHVVRIRVSNGPRTLVDVNQTFEVGGPTMVLRGADGQRLGVLQVTIQDVLGYEKLVAQETGAEIVVRGSAGHVLSSLAAAAQMTLPASGHVDIAATTYDVRSFREPGFAGERLRIWLVIPPQR